MSQKLGGYDGVKEITNGYGEVAIQGTQIVIGAVESPIRNYLLDEYMHHGVSPVAKFREVSLDYALVDISDFSDDEITDAWESFFNDPANADLVAQIEADFF